MAGLLLIWKGPPPAAVPPNSEAGVQSSVAPASQPALLSGQVESDPAKLFEALKQEALEVAEKTAAKYPDDPFVYALLGSAFYNIGRADEATLQLGKCLELNPKVAPAHEVLARIAHQKGQPEETVRICEQALEQIAPNPEILNQLGRALIDLGRTEDAVETLKRAVSLPNPFSQSYYLLGQAQMQAGEFEAAKNAFQKAIELLPDHTQAYFGLATACQRLGQQEEAARHREQFAKLEAHDREELARQNASEGTLAGLPLLQETLALTFFGAGEIYRAHGDGEMAAKVLRRACLLDPENSSYRSVLEGVYLQRREPAEGLKQFEKLAAEQPGNRLNQLFLARAQGMAGQFEAAERSFLKVQELAPKWPGGYRGLAELYLNSGRKTEHLSGLAAKLIELDPNGPHYYLLAVARVRERDRSGALEAVRIALTMNPGDARAQQLLQKLEQTSTP